MQAREVQVDFEKDAPRTGLHLSSIIKSILIGLDPKRFGAGPTSDSYARFEVGFMFEDLLARRRFETIEGRCIQQQVVLQKDGITGTLDGLDICYKPHGKVYESKSTWMSAASAITDPKFKHWFWQTQGYCKMWGTLDAELEVLFVNGTYKPSRPIFKRWALQFTQQEVDEVWTMILNQRHYLESQRRRKR